LLDPSALLVAQYEVQQSMEQPFMSLTVKDLEKLQALCPDDYRMELVNGEIIVMSPSEYESEEVASRMLGKMFPYVDEKRLGRVTGSSAGFILPNSDTRAPDVMVEVKSPTDSIAALQTKIDEFLALGTRVGILLNPEKRSVEIRRSEQTPIILRDGERLTVSELLPDWEVKVEDLWSPEFD
jgi:Uma2 family endonuclease